MVMVCEDCRFFQPEDGDEVDIGQCRRRAPLARLVEPGSASAETRGGTTMTTSEQAIDVFAGLPAIFRDAVCPHAISKYDLATPWRAGEHAVATDGRIIVWRPLDGLDAATRAALEPVPDRRRVADPLIVYRLGGPWREGPTPLRCDSPGMVTCDWCNGSGRLAYDHDPASNPSWECEDCDGTGRVPDYARVPVAPGFDLSAHYAALLVRHRVTCYLPAPGARPVPPAEGVPLRFAGDGFEGLVMPLFPPDRVPGGAPC